MLLKWTLPSPKCRPSHLLLNSSHSFPPIPLGRRQQLCTLIWPSRSIPPSMVLRHSQKSGFAASLANRGSCSFLASFPCDVKTAGIQKCKFFWLSWSSKETNVFSEITEEGWKNRSQEENFWERWKLKRRIGRSQLALLSEDQGCIWRDKRGSNHTL